MTTAFVIACLGVTGAASADEAEWGYEGATGPANWGELAPEFEVCASGRAQSPIDLTNAVEVDLDRIEVDWQPTEWHVVNTGYTIQIAGDDPGGIRIDEQTYDLLQIHFHSPSEHTIDGERFPMEAHLVHAHVDGRLAVIGVMFEPGGDNAFFDAIMAAAPREAQAEPVAVGRGDPGMLLPGNDAFFRYPGSLTTPPCSEVVRWTILAEPVRVGGAAIDTFARMFPMNARPLMPTGNRRLLFDR